jgi:acetolactate synthase-1/2/3 large subunit
MRISDYIVDYLLMQGIRQGFFLNGGMITPLSDSCMRKGLKLYTTHHEQAAAFAAEGQSVVTKNLGFAMGTSGPGATNLITGIASTFFDSHPVLFITGQVNTKEANIDGKRRQVGFQELDIANMTKFITKYSKKVDDAELIVYELEKALFLAKKGRMGPVHLDIPIDVQYAEIDLNNARHFLKSEEHVNLSREDKIDETIYSKIAEEMRDSKRPVILLGNGVKLANAEEEARKIIEISSIPFVTSLLGIDSIENTHPNCYGFIGTYGERYSNFALANADLILVLGSRLDYRQTGVQTKMFAPMAKIIHVDIDETELGSSVHEWLSIRGDLKVFCGNLVSHVRKNEMIGEWIEFLKLLKSRYCNYVQQMESNEIDPIYAIQLISDRYKEEAIIAVDIGANQIWFAKGWKGKRNQTIMINGGMAPMGYSLPAAIGASLARNGVEVLVVTGDGGLLVNMQEFQTVARTKAPVKIVVLNNNALGMIKQFQVENHESRFIGTTLEGGYSPPDFVKIAKAYGLKAISVNTWDKLEEGIDWFVNQRQSCLLNLEINSDYFTYPKSRFTMPVYDMIPLLSREEFRDATRYIKNEYSQ